MYTYHKNHIYDNWLNAPELTDEEKDEIKKFKREEIDLFFNENPFVFGTAGIRRKVGISPQQWNIHTYRLIAVGYAKYIKSITTNNRVLVTHDNRPDGDIFAINIAQILYSFGLEVFFAPNNSSIPTPIVSYLVRKHNFAGAINITASHNPIDYNGFKCYNSTGCQTNDAEEAIILSHVPQYSEIFSFKDVCKITTFNYLSKDYQEEYFSDLTKSLNAILENIHIDKKNVKFLFSSHHGTSSRIMRKYAHDLGFFGFEEFASECTLDLNWKKDEILNPEDKNSFLQSQIHADKYNYEYQIAHDPDSDRSSILEKQSNGQWYFFNGNQIAILLIDFVLNYLNNPQYKLILENEDTDKWSDPRKKSINKKYIVSTYVSGSYIKKLCPENVDIHITKTGFKHIAGKVEEQENNDDQTLLLAFEEAIGCLIFPMCREKDGFQQVAMLLHMICKYKEEGINMLQRYYDIQQKHGFWIGVTKYFQSNHPNWKNEFNDKIQKILNHPIEELFGYQIQTINFNEDSDAVEMIMDNDNWIKFRLSGTEPKFKIYYNLYGESDKEVQQKVKKIHQYFKIYLRF